MPFDPALEIIGEGENAGVNIMGEAWAIGYTRAWVGSSFLTNLPELIMDLSDWKTIEMELKNNLLSYKYEGSNFFLLEYPGKVCNIHNINLTFKGSGSVDWIQVLDANGNLVYEENFDDCSNLTKSTPCPDRSINAQIDVKDKCQYPKVYIKNLNNIEDPLITQVVPPVPVNVNGEYELLYPGEYKFILSRTCPLADSSFVVVVAPPFKDSLIRIVQPVCKDSYGSIIVSGVGGLAPYEYTINGVHSSTGVFHDLSPGTYEIVVTDQNGCSALSSYIIQNPMMSISFGIDSSKFDITCQDPSSFIQLGITPADPDVYFTLDNIFLNNHGYFENMDIGMHEYPSGTNLVV